MTIAATDTVDVSVILPCLNEEAAVGGVIDEAWKGLEQAGVSGEVIVVDNGSSDGSPEIAARHGARVIHESRRGYGAAHLAGLRSAHGTYVVLADADGTYDLTEIGAFVAKLRGGCDLVVGSRFAGGMQRGAMPPLNRWIGNPILTGTLNLLFRAGVSDAHCGLRAGRRTALDRLDLRQPGMEFASEMVVKAAKQRLHVGEVPISYRPRVGDSKLSRVRDAWRHVRFMLLESPTFLFLIPGGALFAIGMGVSLALSNGPIDVLGRQWQLHTMVIAALAALVGAQIVQLGVFARTYAVLYLGEQDELLQRVWGRVRLEHGIAVGAAFLLGGLAALGLVLARWAANGFGNLHLQYLSVLALLLIGLGVQIVFGAFFLSILGLRADAKR